MDTTAHRTSLALWLVDRPAEINEPTGLSVYRFVIIPDIPVTAELNEKLNGVFEFKKNLNVIGFSLSR
jgi:hypothetical protein